MNKSQIKNKFKITKITPDSVYLKGAQGSIKVPLKDFVDSYQRTDKDVCHQKELVEV